MPFIFDLPQQTQIEALYQQGVGTQQAPGAFSPMYDYINNVLITGSPPPTADPVVKQAQLWFSGAKQANSGIGPFAIVIREFTQNQQRLHWGLPAPGGIEPGGLQRASNRVATEVFEDTKSGDPPDRLPWTLLTVRQIARNDASAVGEVLFNIPDSSAAVPQNAAWAGTVLHPLLGDDQSWRLLSAPLQNSDVPAETEADTFDDWRNVYFAQASYYGALRSAILDSGTQLGSIEGFTGLFPDARTALEACVISDRLLTACSPLLDRAMDGRFAEPAFSALTTIAGGPFVLPTQVTVPAQSRVLAQLQSAWSGRMVIPIAAPNTEAGSQLMLQTGSQFFRGVGNAGRTAGAAFRTPGQMVADAIAGTTGPALEARQALEGLSNFVVSGSSSPPPLPGLDAVSREYWVDRGDMLAARNRFDGALVNYGAAQFAQFQVRPTTWIDLTADVQMTFANALSLDAPRTVAFGSASGDTLNGSAGEDRLYGRDGNDTLTGQADDDWLEGGPGSDTYNAGSGRDLVQDEDGQGTLRMNGVTLTNFARLGSDLWQSSDGRFRVARSEVAGAIRLLIVDTTSGVLGVGQDTVEVRNWSAGQLGLNLADVGLPEPPTATVAPVDNSSGGFRDLYDVMSPQSDLVRSGRQYDNVAPSAGNDVVYADAGADRVDGGNDADSIFGEGDNDYLRGGPVSDTTPAIAAADADTVVGGPGTDNLFGGMGADVLHAGDRGDMIDGTGSPNQGDWMLGGRDDDTLIGSVARDFLNGGGGRDTVLAGSGNDVLLGDANYDFVLAGSLATPPFCWPGVPEGTAARHRWNGTAWTTQFATAVLCPDAVLVQLTPGGHFVWSVAFNGDDFSFTPSTARPTANMVRIDADGDADLLRGGAGDDYLQGQTVADILFGDDGNDRLIGDDVMPLPSGSLPGDDQLFGGAGDDRLLGNAGNDRLSGDEGSDTLLGDDATDGTGGADTLAGGAGADTLDGGANADVVDGEAGDDPSVSGGAGDDLVLGGDGNDQLRGDGGGTPAGNDTLDGGDGNDLVQGDGGNDTLSGGAGTDTVEGGDGNDLFVASDNRDTLRGGNGDDVYLVGALRAPIDGTLITRIEDGAGQNRIRFESLVFPSSVTLTAVGANLRVNVSGEGYGLLLVNGSTGNVIQNYEFADGRVFTHSQMLAGRDRDRRSVDAISTGNDLERGTEGPDLFDLLAGNDVGFGLGGADQLSGGPGKDVLDGGSGDDALSGNDDDDRLHGADGADILSGGLGSDRLFGGDGNDTLTAGDGDDELGGGGGNDALNGDAGADLIDGGPGVDTLRGGAGFDEYFFTMDDDLAPGTTIDDAGPNAIRFDASLTPNDVRISIDGADAIVSYGNSSFRILGGSSGGVISEVRFAGRAPISFLILANSLFGDGFELQ